MIYLTIVNLVLIISIGTVAIVHLAKLYTSVQDLQRSNDSHDVRICNLDKITDVRINNIQKVLQNNYPLDVKDLDSVKKTANHNFSVLDRFIHEVNSYHPDLATLKAYLTEMDKNFAQISDALAKVQK